MRYWFSQEHNIVRKRLKIRTLHSSTTGKNNIIKE